MTIGIDIRVLGNKIRSGVEEYTENLLSHMLPLDSSIKYKLFYSSFLRCLPDYPWLSQPNVELSKFRYSNRAMFLFSRMADRPQIDQLLGGVDVFFSPHLLLSSLSTDCRRVTTFHDLSYLHFPEFFSWRRNFWHQFEMRPEWQCRFSDRIIAVSESTKQDITEKYGIDAAKISVIYSGVSPKISRPSDEELVLFRAQKKIPENFILSLCKLEPRKNIIGLILAFNRLKNTGNFRELNLVIAGSCGWLCGDIFREIKKSPHKQNIFLVGQVSDEDRRFYYGLASVFVYPSFFEGFGFPPLEAMACGTPVVASNNSSLPEVVGDAGILVNPYNISDLAFAIQNILKDVELKNTLVKKGLERVKKFNWQITAEKTLQLLTSSFHR